MLNNLRPPDLPLELLRSLAQESYGLSGQWTRLEGERDQNYRVVAENGITWVFKACNPDEGSKALQCQAEALEHIAQVDPDLPVPRLARTRDGARLARLAHEDRDYPIMLLTHLPGEVIGGRQLTSPQLFAVGGSIARLGLAMRGFIHGAVAARRLVWDTRHAEDLRGQIQGLPPEDGQLAAQILDRHRDVTLPRMRTMRSQIIHGDVHPYNCLMSGDGQISGIIDFGDMVHGALVQDLANAAADFLYPGRNQVGTLFEIVRGYASVTRLEEAEADVVLDLVEVRLLITALIDLLKGSIGIESQGYFGDFNARAIPIIRELRAAGRDRLQDEIRRAAAFPRKHVASEQSLADMIGRRRKVMGKRLYVFYDPPVHMVKGEGVWLFDATGRRFLDCYNNVPHVGHCHPYVTEAIVRQARRLNTNTRYITNEAVAYAERLVALSHSDLSAVVFVNSGSEANDLAWRMAKAWTGNRGGLAMDFAYHGVTEATDAFSPSNAASAQSMVWNAPHVRLLPPPDDYRGPYKRGEPDIAARYAGLADGPIGELAELGLGVAAAIVDSAFMTNGILDVAPGYLQSLANKVRAAGGLFIADEVQSGFGRMGTAFWGHQHHGVVPDFITIGKPAGNGHPLGAVITRPEILNHFTSEAPFFSTFGGNNVACAAGLAVLDVIRDEELVDNARESGTYLRKALRGLMSQHALIGDVRGVGLATGVELVRDRTTLEPADTEATRLLGLIRDQGVLVGGEGKYGNVLKIRPPTVFTREHADIAVEAIGRALDRL
ncbi:MAG: aminotransferase class III-fold pyridoxal phosphate-dependent enzyme [Alphaproteobacteria bacterium]|nr:aminotransferase class III-fold pyridoxal phosphate-dependent enzyme [Alphaproteobacteria bacterium]